MWQLLKHRATSTKTGAFSSYSSQTSYVVKNDYTRANIHDILTLNSLL